MEGAEDTPEEQIEINAGGMSDMNPADREKAMDDAVTAAIRATGGAGEEPDAATIAAARARAQQMLGAEDAEGLQHMRNLTLSMGLPATRALFHHMITISRKRGAAKAAAIEKVAQFSPVREVGCMKVDFHNRVTNKPDSAYIRLDQCPRTHNLDTQLDKLRPLVPADKWSEVLKPMSMLIHIGRSTYGNATRQQLPLIRSLFDLPENDPCEKYLDLKVDKNNSTLYIDDSWPNRAGIYVSLEADIQAEKAAAEKAAAAAAK